MANFEFICGSAGTGKTFLARQRLNDITRGCVLTATTGIAAINLGDATTINSLLKYYDTKSLKEQYESGKLDERLTELSKENGIKEIIIDEISMLDADQLDIIVTALDFYNDSATNQISLTLVGDYLQLAPVKAKFAFEASVWPRFERNTTKLGKIYRQTDANFITALLAARKGNGEIAADHFKDRFNFNLDENFDGTTVMAKNVEVNDFNARRLAKIKKPSTYYNSYRDGKELPEWKNIPARLEVKEGALVMLLVNKYVEFGEVEYVNGDLAHFMYSDNGNAVVRLLRTDTSVVVKPLARQNGEIKKGKKQVLGNIKYMPIRLAFATSVHKSQGLTLDKVQINIKNPFIKFPGMMYVALSRARTTEGIRLVGTSKLMIKRCTTDPKVARWL